MEDGSIYLPYEHFSIVMHKKRRIAILCASNIQQVPQKRGQSQIKIIQERHWVVVRMIPKNG